MKIILTGATGFVGGEVLEQALDDPTIDQVTVLTRRALGNSFGQSHSKLKELVIEDFLDYSQVAKDLQADACIWCLGVSQTAVSADEYVTITVDYAVTAVKAMLVENPSLKFCFVSGRGADPEEKSKALFRNIKGRTEKKLFALSPNTFTFQPGFIKHSNSRQQRPLIAKMFVPIAWVVDKFTDGFSIGVATLARRLIDVAKNGATQRTFDNAAMLHWAKQ